MGKNLKSMLLPARVDARATASGLRELAAMAANDGRPAIGAVVGMQFADNTVQFFQLGLCARNADRAARIANQLADSLVWDKT